MNCNTTTIHKREQGHLVMWPGMTSSIMHLGHVTGQSVLKYNEQEWYRNNHIVGLCGRVISTWPLVYIPEQYDLSKKATDTWYLISGLNEPWPSWPGLLWILARGEVFTGGMDMSIQGKENLTVVTNQREKGLICLKVTIPCTCAGWPNMGTLQRWAIYRHQWIACWYVLIIKIWYESWGGWVTSRAGKALANMDNLISLAARMELGATRTDSRRGNLLTLLGTFAHISG